MVFSLLSIVTSKELLLDNAIPKLVWEGKGSQVFTISVTSNYIQLPANPLLIVNDFSELTSKLGEMFPAGIVLSAQS